ncbi:MAG: O-antigen ligase family protein [Bacteroidia bacterium]|nr:O-antigen ligase family protein [Bacteroidia bacterium]
MFGKALASFPIILLGANWLLQGNFKGKWQDYKSNPLFWILISPFLMAVVGFAYSDDMDWAMNAFRINLPLIVLPLVFFNAKPLSEKELNRTLYAFLVACIITTAWSLFYSFVWKHNEEVRDVSRFMSHIRLGLFINLGIAICVYFFYKNTGLKKRLIFACIGLYLVFVLVAMGLASGLVNFAILVLIASFLLLRNQKMALKISVVAALILAALLFGRFIITTQNEQLRVNHTEYNVLKKVNAKGRPLIHFDTLGQKENGNYVLINLQLEDLRNSWNKRVPDDTFSYESQHNLKRYEVLVRYLASKSLNKDVDGVNALSNDDLKNIQNNVVNYQFPEWSYLHKRLYELINEADDYKNKGDVNGHSLTMRWYYWQAAKKVIGEHLLFGVGTGDTQAELNKIYKKDFPELKPEWYKRTHNQFLSIAVCFGLTGFVLFLLAIFYPVFTLRRYLHPLYPIFMVLLLVSFVTEDTLETQAGVGFYAIFNTLFCSVAWFKKQQTPVG